MCSFFWCSVRERLFRCCLYSGSDVLRGECRFLFRLACGLYGVVRGFRRNAVVRSFGFSLILEAIEFGTGDLVSGGNGG